LVELTSGRVLQKVDNEADVFGEGITLLNGLLYQLTWQNGRLIIYDAATLKPLREFPLAVEGWGITHNSRELIVSDGSSTLYFHDPRTFKELRRLNVRDSSGPLTLLNELEYFDGFIYANQWRSNHILKIDPADGRISARLDLSRLAAEVRDRLAAPDSQEVLNGIAWDAAGRQLLVTGKNWPTLFAIRLR
jgi:glutamine cyclotransferase